MVSVARELEGGGRGQTCRLRGRAPRQAGVLGARRSPPPRSTRARSSFPTLASEGALPSTITQALLAAGRRRRRPRRGGAVAGRVLLRRAPPPPAPRPLTLSVATSWARPASPMAQCLSSDLVDVAGWPGVRAGRHRGGRGRQTADARLSLASNDRSPPPPHSSQNLYSLVRTLSLSLLFTPAARAPPARPPARATPGRACRPRRSGTPAASSRARPGPR